MMNDMVMTRVLPAWPPSSASTIAPKLGTYASSATGSPVTTASTSRLGGTAAATAAVTESIAVSFSSSDERSFPSWPCRRGSRLAHQQGQADRL